MLAKLPIVLAALVFPSVVLSQAPVLVTATVTAFANIPLVIGNSEFNYDVALGGTGSDQQATMATISNSQLHNLTVSDFSTIQFNNAVLSGQIALPVSPTKVNINGTVSSGQATPITGTANGGELAVVNVSNVTTTYFFGLGAAKSPLCVDPDGLVYAGNNTGIGAPCP
jgi:hypothetical protein